MKRFGLLAIVVLALVAMGSFGYMCGTAQADIASDFAGKWIGYKMVVEQGGQSNEMHYKDMMGADVKEEALPYVEIKDGKAIIVSGPGEDPDERAYKVSGEKLIVELDPEDGAGTAEFSIEKGELLLKMVTPDGTLTSYFKRPQ